MILMCPNGICYFIKSDKECSIIYFNEGVFYRCDQCHKLFTESESRSFTEHWENHPYMGWQKTFACQECSKDDYDVDTEDHSSELSCELYGHYVFRLLCVLSFLALLILMMFIMHEPCEIISLTILMILMFLMNSETTKRFSRHMATG